MDKLNILWIVVDKLRFDSFSGRYDINAITPNIDNLCRNGMSFSNAYTSGGYSAWINSAIDVKRSLNKCKSPFINKFKNAGYHTSWVGKPISSAIEGLFSSVKIEANSPRNTCDVFCKHLVELKGRPFFSVIAFDALSIKAECKEELLKYRYNVPCSEIYYTKTQQYLADYYASIREIDCSIGLIREQLKTLDMDKNTVIMLMSSGGSMLGSHGSFDDESFYNESVHVPFVIARLGGGERMRIRESEVLVSTKDITQATLALSGIKNIKFSRKNLAKLTMKRKISLIPYAENKSILLKGSASNEGESKKAWCVLVTKDGWKYVCYTDVDAYMFNNKMDAHEMTNMAFDFSKAKVKFKLHTTLKMKLKSQKDNFRLPKYYL